MAGIEDIRKAFARAKALNDVPNARRFAQMLVDYAPAPAPKREVGIDEAFGIGFDRGKGRLGSLITDIVPALLGSVVGADEYAQRQLEEAAAKEAALPAPIFESFKDVGGVGDAAKFALETMGEQLPNLAIAVGTGLTAGVAAPVLLGGRAVATKAVTEIAKKKALELVAKQTVAGQFAGATFGSYALNAPEVFQNIYQETGETAPGTALLFGLAAASLDSLLPAALARNISAPVKAEVVKKLLLKSGMKPSVLRSGTAGFAKGLGLEGITEGAQEAISIAAERLIDDNPDVFGSKEFDRIMEAGVRGAVAGGSFGTIGGGIEGAREQAARGQRLEELKETRKLRDEFNKKTAEDAALTTSIEEIQNQQAQGDLFGAPVASTLVPLSIPDALTTYESSPAYISELETRTDAGETEEQARTFLLDRKYQELAAIEQDRDTARGQTTRPETPIAEFTPEQVLAEAERRTALNSRTDVQKELLKVWAEVRAAKTEAAKTGPALIKKQIEMLTPEGKLTPALERQARVADLAAKRQAAADAKTAGQVIKDEAAAVRVADLAARRQAAADAKAEVTRLTTDSKRINNAEQLELNLPEAIPPTQVTGDAGQGDLFAGLPDQTRIPLVGNSAFLKAQGLPNNSATLKAIEGLDFSIPEQREQAIRNLDELAKRSTSTNNINAVQAFIKRMTKPVTPPETPKAVETKAKPATTQKTSSNVDNTVQAAIGNEGTFDPANPKINQAQGEASYSTDLSPYITDFDSAVAAIVKYASNPAQREIAQKLAVRLRQLKAAGVEFSLEITPEGRRLRGARGQNLISYSGLGEATTVKVTLNHPSNGDQSGTGWVVVAHELAHAATQAQIKYAPNGTAAVKLNKLFADVVAHFNQRAKEGNLTEFEKRIYSRENNALQHPNELLAWGLTSEPMQRWLDSVKSKNGSFLSRLFDVVSSALGFSSNDTALSELMSIADGLLTETFDTYTEVANKQGRSFGKQENTTGYPSWALSLAEGRPIVWAEKDAALVAAESIAGGKIYLVATPTGISRVDVGSYTGDMLPPARLKEVRAAAARMQKTSSNVDNTVQAAEQAPTDPSAKPGAKRSVLSTRMGKEGETLEVKNPHTVKTLFAAMQEAFPGVYAPLESAGLVRIITSDQIPKSISDRKFSKADIEKLTSERGTSLALFANNFVERIAAKDRTLADANKIATEIVDEAVSSPEKFLPVTTAANIRVIHDRFLKMPDGLSYDPDNLAHANASVETTTIYALRKNGSISSYEEEEARRLNNERADALSGLASYLKDNSDYDPSEAATAIALASQYGIRGDKSKDGKIQYRAIEILADNQTPIIVVDGAFAALLVENLRGGISGKAAVVKSYESMVEKAKAAKDSLSDGLHKFKQSDEESDAVALNKAAYGTPWCTGTAVSTARSQLSGGDFYVYYKEGKPQIAFRLNGQNQLAEPPRGTLPGQGLTAEQTDIADDLLRSGKIPGGEDFLSDQDLIKNVMHNLDKMSDVDVFVSVWAKRKSANGYGHDSKKFPPSIYTALQRESNRRGLNASKGYYDVIGDGITQDQAEQVLVVREYIAYLRNAFTFKRLVYAGGISNNSGDMSFPVLETVGGIYDNSRAMSFPVLKTAGNIAHNSGDISFPVLETVGDIYDNSGDISFPALETADNINNNKGAMSFPALKTSNNIAYNSGDISFPVLETVRDINNNNGTMSFPALKTSKDINYNRAAMSFPVLETTGGITDNNGTMSFPALKTSRDINYNNGAISFPVLETVGDIYSNRAVMSFPVLKTATTIAHNNGDISFPLLETARDIYDNSGDMSFPVLKTAGDISHNSGDISFPALKIAKNIFSNTGGAMSFPALKIAKNIFSNTGGAMSFPALEAAGDIYDNSRDISFPALKIAKNIFSNTGVMSFPALKTVRDKNDILFSADGNILAYVEDGKVVFVADNIPKDHNVRGLMLHEIGVHLRSLGASDTEFQAILTRLEAARKAGNKAVIAAFDRVPKDTPANLVTEEAAGYLVEMAPESSFARQLLTWIKAKLKAWIRATAKGRNLMVLTQWANSITQDELVMMATAATSADSSLFNSDADNRSLNVQGEYLNKSQLKAPVYKGVAFDADLKQLAARGRLAPVLNKLIPKQSAEIQRILRKIATQNLRTRIVVGPTPEGSSGVYDPITDVITLDPTLGMNEHTILHEMGHAALAQAVNNPDLQITKDFFKFFSDIKLQMGDAYGGQNLQEFVGELIGNPEFQALLKNIKAPKSESMWKNILDAILKFFTFRKGQSAYNKGLDFIDKLLDVSQGVEPTLTDQLFLGTPAMGVKAIGNIMNSGKKLAGSKKEDLQNALSKLGSTTKGGAILSNALRALRLNDLVKLYGDKIPALERLRDAILERQGATEKARKAVQIKYIKFKKINKKKPAQTAELAEVASEARREGFDLVKVDPEFKVDALSPQQKVKFNKLMVRLRNLDPDVQEMYKDIRADYRRMYDQYKKYVLDQVKDGTKRKELEARFLKETSAPGYVPFLRFGDYFLDYTDAATKTRVVKAFESPRERTNFLEANKSKIQNEKQFDRTANAIFDKKSFPPASFVFQLMEALPPDQQAIVYDQLLTLYPENSFMQRTRAADKVEGESKDLVQGYADTMLKWVTKQSSLEFSPKIQNSLSEIKSAKVTGVEAAVKNEMGRREEFITNPNYGPWTAFFATSAYNLFLTGNISAAIVNLSALVLLSGPLLTGVYGFNKTSAALLKAMAVAKPKFNDWNSDTGAFEAAWTKDPKYKTLVAGLDAKGQREHTLQREILEGSRQSTVEYDAFGARFMNLASVPFTEAEKYSRGTTAIAAYELAKAAGKSDAAAVEEAVQLVMDVHTSGVAAEGPQLMQGSLGRVMFTFKTFVWNSATIVAMTARKAFQKEPSDVRRIARKQLLGIYAMSAAIGGINGLPFYGFLTTLTNMIGALAGAFDDDDEPFNFRDETREFTNEFLYKGPLNYITNLEISNRVGLANGLLFQEDPYSVEQNGYIMTAVMQAMGPVGSYALNIERNAGRLLEQGEYGRFFEAIAPSSLRNIFKTGRYIQEGARTMDGEPIIENINSWNLFMQAFGFGPADLSSLYEVGGAGLNYQSKVRATRQKILKKYYMGITTGDSGLIAEAIQEFTKFGREFPKLVNSDTLNRSFKSRQAYERDLVYGMKFDAGLKRKINERYLDEFIEI